MAKGLVAQNTWTALGGAKKLFKGAGTSIKNTFKLPQMPTTPKGSTAGLPPSEQIRAQFDEEESTEQEEEKQNPYEQEKTEEEVTPAALDETFAPVIPEVKPLLESFQDIKTTAEMEQLLFKIGTFLVHDKSQLSKWIQGIQQKFSLVYVQSRELTTKASEMEVLKEFLAIKIEQLQIRVQELMNEKEDLEAMH